MSVGAGTVQQICNGTLWAIHQNVHAFQDIQSHRLGPISYHINYSLGFLELIGSIVFRFRGSVSLDVACTRIAVEFWSTRYILGNTGAIYTKFLGNTSHQITVHLITINHLMIKNHPVIMSHSTTSSHLADQRITMYLLVRTCHLSTTDHSIKRNSVMWTPVVICHLMSQR